MSETVVRIPTLETERLVLRAPRPSDLDAYAAFRASRRSRFLGGPLDRAESFAKLGEIVGHWHLRGFGRWIVANREDDAPLGLAGPFFPEGWPEPEIAWSLFHGAEGRGIATEAALAARDYAYRRLGWQTAVSLIAPDNARSIALARRLDAVRDGAFEHEGFGTLHVWRHPAPDVGASDPVATHRNDRSRRLS